MNRLVTHLCQATSATYLPAVTQFRLKLAIPAVLEEQCVRCRCNAHIYVIKNGIYEFYLRVVLTSYLTSCASAVLVQYSMQRSKTKWH